MLVGFGNYPQNKVRWPKRGKSPNSDMAKIQNISEIHPIFGFAECDVLENIVRVFDESELGKLYYTLLNVLRIMIESSFTISNYKIISDICNVIASWIGIDFFSKSWLHIGNLILSIFTFV